MEEVHILLQEVMLQLLLLDTMSWNSCIITCEKDKDWEGACGFLQSTAHQGLTPDVVG